MSEETIFTKIINGTIPSKTIYHDDLVTAEVRQLGFQKNC